MLPVRVVTRHYIGRATLATPTKQRCCCRTAPTLMFVIPKYVV